MTGVRAIATLLAAAAIPGCGPAVRPASQPIQPPDPPVPPASHTSSTDRAARDAAYSFLDGYTDADGRVVRRDEGGDTVGEGQAYGMLAAAAVGDGARFDRIWRWTRAHLMRTDGLLSFHWADGRVQDPQAAADADLDTAHALLVASCSLRRPDLRAAAVRLGGAVLANETARPAGGPVLAAGPWAVDSHIVVNPSYLDPQTLIWLAQASGDERFSELARDGRRVIGALARPLPPDWGTIARATGTATAAATAVGAAGPARFGFDAPRTLVRLAADPDPVGRRIAARAWRVFRGRPADTIVVEHELDGRPAGGTHHPVALVAAAGAASAAGDRVASGRLLDAAAALQRARPTYYGAAWVALGRLMLTTDRLQAKSCPNQ
jgi:endoglucanase